MSLAVGFYGLVWMVIARYGSTLWAEVLTYGNTKASGTILCQLPRQDNLINL